MANIELRVSATDYRPAPGLRLTALVALYATGPARRTVPTEAWRAMIDRAPPTLNTSEVPPWGTDRHRQDHDHHRQGPATQPQFSQRVSLGSQVGIARGAGRMLMSDGTSAPRRPAKQLNKISFWLPYLICGRLLSDSLTSGPARRTAATFHARQANLANAKPIAALNAGRRHSHWSK